MAFAKSLFSNLFGKADIVESGAGGPAHQSPQTGHSDIAFKSVLFMRLLMRFPAVRCPLLTLVPVHAVSQILKRQNLPGSGTSMNTLHNLISRYGFSCDVMLLRNKKMSMVVYKCSTQSQRWTSS